MRRAGGCPLLLLVLTALFQILMKSTLAAPLKAENSVEEMPEFVRYIEEMLQADPHLRAEFEKRFGGGPVAKAHPAELRELIETVQKRGLGGDAALDQLDVRSPSEEHERLVRERMRTEYRRRRERELGLAEGSELPEVVESEIEERHQLLEELDEIRRDGYKQRLMERERQRRAELEGLGPDEHKRREEAATRAKDAAHPQVHHPGSREQLEEAYENKGFDEDDFDPKTFFKLYDINSDDFLDAEELETIFVHEAQKIHPGEDSASREDLQEEIARMREHVVGEVDTDKDSRVSWDEFLVATEADDFEEDPGWDELNEDEEFDELEFEEYRARWEEEQRAKAAHDELPPLPDDMDPEERAVAEQEREHLRAGNVDGLPDHEFVPAKHPDEVRARAGEESED